jgi:hypothetical protein
MHVPAFFRIISASHYLNGKKKCLSDINVFVGMRIDATPDFWLFPNAHRSANSAAKGVFNVEVAPLLHLAGTHYADKPF